jgi:outer membrane protein assembly factor BamE (lipoprotein component of BamABCDE complex)
MMFIVSLVGCATSGRMLDRDQISQIKQDITTKEEVITLLGKPNADTMDGDGKEILTYASMKYRTRASTFIPVVGLMTGGADVDQQTVQILIGHSGVVEKIISSDSANKINSGLLNQGK